MPESHNPLLKKLTVIGLVSAIGATSATQAVSQTPSTGQVPEGGSSIPAAAVTSGGAGVGVAVPGDATASAAYIAELTELIQASPRGIIGRQAAAELSRFLNSLPARERRRAFRTIQGAGGLPTNIAREMGVTGTRMENTSLPIY